MQRLHATAQPRPHGVRCAAPAAKLFSFINQRNATAEGKRLRFARQYVYDNFSFGRRFELVEVHAAEEVLVQALLHIDEPWDLVPALRQAMRPFNRYWFLDNGAPEDEAWVDDPKAKLWSCLEAAGAVTSELR